jgi:hypothetical protein
MGVMDGAPGSPNPHLFVHPVFDFQAIKRKFAIGPDEGAETSLCLVAMV